MKLSAQTAAILGLSLVMAIMAGVAGAQPVEAQRRRARQRRVRVTVADVAGGRAYLHPGASRGVHVGAQVRLARRRFRVVGVTASNAVVELGESSVAVGARGVAMVRRGSTEDGVQPLPEPQALSSYEGRWPDAVHPSVGQHPEPVPLGGEVGRARQLVIHVSTNTAAYVPVRGGGDGFGRGELRARVRAQPFLDVPFTINADASLQLWLGSGAENGPGTRSRPNLRVRELQVAYGQQDDFYAALGRLRYAASTLGLLDGIRVQTPALGPLTVAGFGGFVPDPQSGEPAFNVGRFGLEATLRDPGSDLRPVVTVVAHGSVWDGEIDERRLSGAFHLYPGESHLGGTIEVSMFDADNAWGGREVQVTAASLDTTLRFDWFRVGARASMRQPERSKWLLSLYGPSFLCTLSASSTTDDRCLGFADLRVLGTADVGGEVDDVAATVGATVVHTGTSGQFDQVAAFAAFRAVRILGYGHLDVSATASTGYFLETLALRADLGVAIVPEVFDVTLRYRPAVSQYVADFDPFVEHLFGGRVLVRPIPEIDVLLDADGLIGRQIDAFIAQLSVAWHGAF